MTTPTLLSQTVTIGRRTDVPPAVLAALDDPADPEFGVVEANGIPFATRAWGDPAADPVLLVHGVVASSRVWWRIGPALAAGLGRRIVAVDQAGHGRTGHWAGHHRFADNAVDLAAFAVAAGIARPGLRVVGHSWGGMTAAALPGAGLASVVLVLLDPPAVSVAAISTMLDDPIDHHYDAFAEALAALGSANPTWPYGDVAAKAEALTQFDEGAVRAILTQNGDWDGGLAALADPASAEVPIWLVRGEPASGGLVPDDAAARFAERIGADHVITISGGSHSPMRLKPAETTAALLRALGAGAAPPEEDEPRTVGERVAAVLDDTAGRVGHAASAVGSAVLGEAAERVEQAASVVGAAVGAAGRILNERPGARVRRIRRLGRVPLPYLYDVHPDARRRTPRELGVKTIDVDRIAGTAVGPAKQRGSDFLPLRPFRSPNWKARWQRIGGANDRLAILPPIDVLRYDDTYWVVDGHNRVGQALYSGQAAIDADVTDLVDPAHPQADPAESFASLAEDSRELRKAVGRSSDRGSAG